MSAMEKMFNKKSENFTKRDIISFARKNSIGALNFRYVAEGGRLKTLNFSFNDEKHLDKILSYGERVDGSSLFKGIDAASNGFLDKDSKKFAMEHYADKNIFKSKENEKKFHFLPSSCHQSAKSPIEDRYIYENEGFLACVIDSIASKLSSYGDENLSEKLYGKDEEIRKLVDSYLYC